MGLAHAGPMADMMVMMLLRRRPDVSAGRSSIDGWH
jgi:hypothetical protein